MADFKETVQSLVANNNKYIIDDIEIQMAKVAENTKLLEMHDVTALGGFTHKMVGRRYFDESKPRLVHKRYKTLIAVSDYEFNNAKGAIDLVSNAVVRIGSELGSAIHGECCSCEHLHVSVGTTANPTMMQTEISSTAACKLEGRFCAKDNPFDQFKSVYGQISPNDMFDISRPENPFIFTQQDMPLFRGGFGEGTPPKAPEPPVVRDDDIEVEVKKLNKSYGLY